MPKKSKSISKSDKKALKPWLRKISSSSYGSESRSLNKMVLIVCEGQTEARYFESFPVLGMIVKIENLKGESKLKLINSTIDIKKKSDIDFDEIWCVFDMDVKKGAKEFLDFDNAIKKGLQSDFKIAYSNDSFELWFYLHYQYIDQQNHRSFYNKQLGVFWGMNYDKECKKNHFCSQIYDKLKSDVKSSQSDAIKNAKKLFRDQSDLIYHKQNPITLVFKLVEFLNKNKRK